MQLMNKMPTDRVGRYPKHTSQVESIPFTLQPFFMARVLPAETLKNIYFESRVVTSPVLSSIIGYKKEYFFFYVKITDLLDDAIRDMFVDPTNGDLGATKGEAANNPTWYTAKGGINWLQRATKRVVETYFRDDGETMEQYQTTAGLPIVQIRENSFMDSLTDKDDVPVGADLSGAANVADLERLLDAFAQLQALGFSQMSYEDFLRSNGISIPNKDENKPEELVRFTEFQYPSNHISTDAANAGSATSALSWVFKNGNRDPKFFREPGFIVGFSVVRPKVYFGGLNGSAAGFAARAWDWMPNYLREIPETSLKKFELDTGPLGERATNADAYFLDMRDELLYGDQFQNVAPAGSDPILNAGRHVLPLPDASLNWRYPTEAMCRGFFVDTAAGRVRQDGYVSLSIKGFETDNTKSTSVAVV